MEIFICVLEWFLRDIYEKCPWRADIRDADEPYAWDLQTAPEALEIPRTPPSPLRQLSSESLRG